MHTTRAAIRLIAGIAPHRSRFRRRRRTSASRSVPTTCAEGHPDQSFHTSCRSRSAPADAGTATHLSGGGEAVRVSLSMRVMSAGDGYKYLLRTVAAADGVRPLSTPLTRYYAEAG